MRKNKRTWSRGPHFRDGGISRARMMVDMWKFERKYCFIGLGTIQEAVKLYHRASRRHAQVQIEEQLMEMWGDEGVEEV